MDIWGRPSLQCPLCGEWMRYMRLPDIWMCTRKECGAMFAGETAGQDMKRKVALQMDRHCLGLCPRCGRMGVRYETLRGLWRCKFLDCAFFPTDAEVEGMRWTIEELPRRTVRDDEKAPLDVRAIPTVPVVASYSGGHPLTLATVSGAIIHYEDIPSLDEKESSRPPTQCSVCGDKPGDSYLTRCHYCGRTLCYRCLTVVREGYEFHDSCPNCARTEGMARARGAVRVGRKGGGRLEVIVAGVLPVGFAAAVLASMVSASMAIVVALVTVACATGPWWGKPDHVRACWAVSAVGVVLAVAAVAALLGAGAAWGTAGAATWCLWFVWYCRKHRLWV